MRPARALHTIAHLRRARRIDEIAITTSTEPEDDAIAEFGKAQRILATRGPEQDVLEGFEIAARASEAQILVRITGDVPLIDPELVDYLVAQMDDADFLMLEDGVKCMQEGVDPFSRRALEVMLREARNDPVAREHVTAWLKQHPEAVRTKRISIPAEYQFTGARLSIDTPADLAFMEAVGARLPLDTVSLPEVAALLRREPWLMTINAHIHQKSAAEQAQTVLLRADGGGKLGLGHLMRALSLAEALRDREGLGVCALLGVHPEGDSVLARQVFEARKIPVMLKPPGITEEAFIADEIARTKAAALVIDIRTPLNRGTLEGFKARGTRIVAVDDSSDRRLAADLAIYPPVPQPAKLDWSGFTGERMAGAECVLLSPLIARAVKERRAWLAKAPRLLVSMGGSDPLHLTGTIAAACTRTLGDEMPIDVVVGPSVENVAELVAWLKKLPGVVVHRSPKNVAALYNQASLAIVSFGVTAYELAALGVPALYIALTEDHRESALAAEKLGFGRLIAMARDLIPTRLAAQAASLLSSPGELAHMSAQGRAAIDGEGAERIARKIAALIAPQAADQARGAQSQRLQPNLRPAVGG